MLKSSIGARGARLGGPRLSPLSASGPVRNVVTHAHSDGVGSVRTSRREALGALLVLGSVLPAYADELVADVTETATAVAAEVVPAAEVVAVVPELQVAQAADAAVAAVEAAPAVVTTPSAGTQLVYLDVKLEGKPLGRIVIRLFDDVKTGSARFRDLVVGKQGVGYRLSRFDGVYDTYIRCEGVKSLSYSATMESQITGGDNLEQLEQELAKQQRHHDSPGLVSLIVADAEERPTKEKLIARDGKLVTVVQQLGEAPNGTTFTITRGSDRSLDGTNLIVGEVVEGLSSVVEAIGSLPYARPRDSYYDQPFFQVAKAIGDKRADTAEKGFNRPFKRVVVTGGGVL